MSIIDLAKHVRKKEEAKLTQDELSNKLADEVGVAIERMTHEVLQLDLRTGGGNAAQALGCIADLTDALMLHYVSDLKASFSKHTDKFVCIPREAWDKIAAQEICPGCETPYEAGLTECNNCTKGI